MNSERNNKNITLPIYLHGKRIPSQPALMDDRISINYNELANLCVTCGDSFLEDGASIGGRIAIISQRSIAAVIAIYSACWIGCTYIPINSRTPSNRILKTIQACSPDLVVIVEEPKEKSFDLSCLKSRAAVVALKAEAIASALQRIRRLGPIEKIQPPSDVDENSLAYIIHTSGTTGVPKGVGISNANIHALISSMQQILPIDENDRIAQFAELSFDASIYDLFVGIKAAATICLVPDHLKTFPVPFVKKCNATVWPSVPSIATHLARCELVEPGALANLRLTIFGGEALLINTAQAWQKFAPNSQIINIYGPTEATVNSLAYDCTHFETIHSDVIPIGRPLENVSAALVDQNRSEITAPHEKGELVLWGPHVAMGYLNRDDLTADKFERLIIKGVEHRCYLTGDIAYVDDSSTYFYVGRKDNQIKILGKRVELEEIEKVLRDLSSSSSAAAIPWPVVDGAARGVIAFLEGSRLASEKVREAVATVLPDYMIPSAIYTIDTMPLTLHGKINRQELLDSIEA